MIDGCECVCVGLATQEVSPAPLPSHPNSQNVKTISIAGIRSQSVPTLLRPTGQYQYVVPPRLTQTPPPAKNVVTKAEIKAAIASIDPVLLAALGNPRDRITLTKLEMDVQRFLRNAHMTRLDFPPMSSYQRLMAHRVAEYYHMEHTAVDLDNSRRAVVLFKTVGSRCPDVQLINIPEEDAAQASVGNPNVVGKSPTTISSLLEQIPDEVADKEIDENVPYEPDPDMPPLLSAEPPKQFKILRRKQSPAPPENNYASDSSPKNSQIPGEVPSTNSPTISHSKSFPPSNEKTLEERERDYALARARIFSSESLEATLNASETPSNDTDENLGTKPIPATAEASLQQEIQEIINPPEASESSIPRQNSQECARSTKPGPGYPVRNHTASPSANYHQPMGKRSPANFGMTAPNPSLNSNEIYWGNLPDNAPLHHPVEGYHWGISPVRPSHPHNIYPENPIVDNNWASHGCFPVYDHQWYPYFNPHSRQMPLFVPNGYSSQICSDNTFGTAPIGYSTMHPAFNNTRPFPGMPAPSAPKGRSHPGYPPPNLPRPTEKPHSPSNVPQKADIPNSKSIPGAPPPKYFQQTQPKPRPQSLKYTRPIEKNQ